MIIDFDLLMVSNVAFSHKLFCFSFIAWNDSTHHESISIFVCVCALKFWWGLIICYSVESLKNPSRALELECFSFILFVQNIRSDPKAEVVQGNGQR